MAERASIVSVCMSLTIQRDYESRAVFPDLRLDPRRFEATGALIVRMTRSQAREVLIDARREYSRPYVRADKGTKKVYGALIETLTGLLEPQVSGTPPAAPADARITLDWLAFVEEAVQRYVALDSESRPGVAREMRDARYLPAMPPKVRRRILERMAEADDTCAERNPDLAAAALRSTHALFARVGARRLN